MRRSRALISASAGSSRAMMMSAFFYFLFFFYFFISFYIFGSFVDAGAAAAGKLRIGRASPRKLARRATQASPVARASQSSAQEVVRARARGFGSGGGFVDSNRPARIYKWTRSTRISLRVARGEALDESARHGVGEVGGVCVCGRQPMRQSRPVRWGSGAGPRAK